MAKQEYTAYQQGIISNYYNQLDTIMLTKLQELVSELYMADTDAKKKRLWDRDDPDELWQRIFWAFHQSVCRIDLARRRDRLVQRIYNATIHRLHDDYRRDWLHAEREVATAPAEMPALAGGTDGSLLNRAGGYQYSVTRTTRLEVFFDANGILAYYRLDRGSR